MKVIPRKRDDMEAVQIESLEILTDDDGKQTGMKIELERGERPDWFGHAVSRCAVSAYKGEDEDHPDFVDVESIDPDGLVGVMTVGTWVVKTGDSLFLMGDKTFHTFLVIP